MKTNEKRGSNGWREGRDPIQRLLRVITVLVILGVFVYTVVDRRGIDDWPTIALCIGAILVLLGYEGVVRLPYLGKPDNPAGYQPPPQPPPYRQYSPPYEAQDEYHSTPASSEQPAYSEDNPPPPEGTP